MDVKDLAKLVRETRLAQRRYFSSRSSADLTAAKRLEVELDNVTAELLEEPRQPGLFDGEGGDASA